MLPVCEYGGRGGGLAGFLSHSPASSPHRTHQSPGHSGARHSTSREKTDELPPGAYLWIRKEKLVNIHEGFSLSICFRVKFHSLIVSPILSVSDFSLSLLVFFIYFLCKCFSVLSFFLSLQPSFPSYFPDRLPHVPPRHTTSATDPPPSLSSCLFLPFLPLRPSYTLKTSCLALTTQLSS